MDNKFTRQHGKEEGGKHYKPINTGEKGGKGGVVEW